jgi:hypothetical protein
LTGISGCDGRDSLGNGGELGLSANREIGVSKQLGEVAGKAGRDLDPIRRRHGIERWGGLALKKRAKSAECDRIGRRCASFNSANRERIDSSQVDVAT